MSTEKAAKNCPGEELLVHDREETTLSPSASGCSGLWVLNSWGLALPFLHTIPELNCPPMLPVGLRPFLFLQAETLILWLRSLFTFPPAPPLAPHFFSPNCLHLLSIARVVFLCPNACRWTSRLSIPLLSFFQSVFQHVTFRINSPSQPFGAGYQSL